MTSSLLKLALGVLIFAGSNGIATAQHQMPRKFANRIGGRAKLEEPVRAAIRDGLAWFAAHQEDKGHWDAMKFMRHDDESAPSSGAAAVPLDVGVTGLALLAFLADGQLKGGEHEATVRRGLEWLIGQQSKNGRIGTAALSEFIYCHLLSSLALFEAYGLSGETALRAPAQKAVEYTLAHRNPYKGWRYFPKDNDSDTSVTAWAAATLLTARECGLAADLRAIEDANLWITSMTDPFLGRTGYVSRGARSARLSKDHARQYDRGDGEAMAGVSLLVSFFQGVDPTCNPVLEQQLALIATLPPKWDKPHVDLYFWYGATHGMWLAGNERRWQKWRKALHAALLPAQSQGGAERGSWDPIGVWGSIGGRIYSTALSLLCLQAEYRYSRLGDSIAFPKTKAFGPVRRAWQTRKFGSLAQLIEKLDADEALPAEERRWLDVGRDAVAFVDDGATRAVRQLAATPDPFAQLEGLGAIAKQFRGLPAGDLADERLKKLKSQSKWKSELRAARALHKAVDKYDFDNRKHHAKLEKALTKLIDKDPITDAAKQAKLYIKELD